MHIKQTLGLVGSIALLAGVFTPIVSIPVMGEMTYLQNGRTEGIIVLVLAFISLLLALTRQYRGLWITGIGSLAVLLYTFVRFQSKMSDMKSDMESPLSGTPFHGLVDIAMQSVQFQWGWAVLLVGAGLVLAAAVLKED